MLTILIVLFLTAIISPFLVRVAKGYCACLLVISPLFGFAHLLYLNKPIRSGLTIHEYYNWFNELGIALSFYLDGLSFLFAILIMGIGVLIVFYTSGYQKNRQQCGRFYAYLFLFMGSMLGLVLADNLITLFIFWELTSLTSYLLISFDHARAAARDAAQKAMFITVIGGLALLVSFVLINTVTHTFEFTQLLLSPDAIRNSPYYLPILLLLLLGAFTKSAQFPFHFWLPRAMEAPTPVSAYLHSATMVQAGVYLLARFHPLLSGTTVWFATLTTIGGITMISGIVLAIRESDIKLVLAYTTVSALGSLVYMLSSNQDITIKACVAFLLAHALYKAPLFLAAGNIQFATGHRDLNQMHGLARKMPVTFVTTLISAASMAGLPPLLGFFVKEMIYEAKLLAPTASELLIAIVILTNAGFVLVSLLLIFKPFFGTKGSKDIREAEFPMWFSALLLSLSTLAFSLFPSLIDKDLLAPAVTAITTHPVDMHLKLWHGFTPSLSLSIITLLIGILIYIKRDTIVATTNLIKKISFLWPEVIYERTMKLLIKFAEIQTNIIQNGRLSIYLFITILTATLILGFGLINTPLPLSNTDMPFSWFSIFLLGGLILTAIAAAIASQLITAIIFLGAFGIGTALFFLINAAPDVAMTQVLVDTLFVVIFALSLYKFKSLPILERHTEKTWPLIAKLLLAICAGSTIGCLLFAVLNVPFNTVVNDYFIQNSVLLGHGRNIVNVILIDFRAFDTMGETIVIIIAAIGVYGLIRKKTTRSIL